MLEPKDNLDYLAVEANKKDMTLVTLDTHHLLALPAGVTRTTSGFQVFVHVPMLRPDSLMQVYQHIPLPVPIPHDRGTAFVQFTAGVDTIALSTDKQTFRITSVTELTADCTKVGNFFACPRGNTARKTFPNATQTPTEDPGLCLWGLLTSEADTIAATCQKSFVAPGNAVVQLTARSFITYGKATGNITCRDNNLQTSFHTTQYGSFHLPPGCSATSEQFTLHSSDSALTRNEDAWAESTLLPRNLSHIIDNINISDVHDLMVEAR